MALTKTQLDSLDKLLAKSPPLKKKDPQAYEKLNAAVTQTVKKFTPEMKEWARTAGSGFAPEADMADAVVSAVVTAVIDTVVIVTVSAAVSSDLGAEVEKLGEANIRAIAKDRMSRAAQRM